MKLVTIKMIIIIILIFIPIAALIGCSPGIDQSHEFVWDKEDLLIIKVASEEGEDAQVAQYETSVVMEPKYYTGSMPLSYTVAYAPEKAPGSFGAVSMSGLPMIYEFDNFTNLFISDESDLYVIGASTIEGEKIVAEAKLLSNDGSDQLQIEEFHYNSDENLIFYCKSQFDSLGFKVSETEAKGTKIKDYYFIWPTP